MSAMRLNTVMTWAIATLKKHDVSQQRINTLMGNTFNLIDEPWLPIADVGRVSLRQVFSEPSYRALGGNPVQKIALMKLLLAIAQAAYTPEDEDAWQALGAEGLAQRCLAYLEQWHERFYLYGDKPFLQMPAIAAAKLQSYGAVLPEIANGNTTVLKHTQIEQVLIDADKALLLITLMGFALGGKQVDNSISLSTGYVGKSSSGKSGPAVARNGLLHSLLLGQNLWHSLWLNLWSKEALDATGLYQQGVGIAPWEQMPEGEACSTAQGLQQSLMGRLLPLCRFCLLKKDGLHYSEGIAHADYNGGMFDPTVAIDTSAKKTKALWANPEKRPWRELTALLSLFSQGKNRGFQCWQVDMGLKRVAIADPVFALWSGGLKVTNSMGEEQPRKADDFVESQVWLNGETLGDNWFATLQGEMTGLDEIAKALYACVMAYFKTQLVDGKNMAALATHHYWQLCERDFQNLLDNCGQGEENRSARRRLRQRFASYVQQAYDRYCPQDTARQLDAWAQCRPKLGKYLKQED